MYVGLAAGRVAVLGGASSGGNGGNVYQIDNGAQLVVEGTPLFNPSYTH